MADRDTVTVEVQIAKCPNSACGDPILAHVHGVVSLDADSPGSDSVLRLVASFKADQVTVHHTCVPPF